MSNIDIEIEKEEQDIKCPECDGLGGLPNDNPETMLDCCWRCGGAGTMQAVITIEDRKDKIYG